MDKKLEAARNFIDNFLKISPNVPYNFYVSSAKKANAPYISSASYYTRLSKMRGKKSATKKQAPAQPQKEIGFSQGAARQLDPRIIESLRLYFAQNEKPSYPHYNKIFGKIAPVSNSTFIRYHDYFKFGKHISIKKTDAESAYTVLRKDLDAGYRNAYREYCITNKLPLISEYRFNVIKKKLRAESGLAPIITSPRGTSAIYHRLWTTEQVQNFPIETIKSLLEAIGKSTHQQFEIVQLAEPPSIEVRVVTH